MKKLFEKYKRLDTEALQRTLTSEVVALKLLNESLIELLVKEGLLTKEDVLAKVKEIDMRDGVLDGDMHIKQVCTHCSSTQFEKNRCMICGELSEEVETLLVDKLV